MNEDTDTMSKCECEPNECCANLTRLRSEIERLRADAVSALANGGVLVRIGRPEGYEDVHPELVAEDAMASHWPEWEVVGHNAGVKRLDGREEK